MDFLTLAYIAIVVVAILCVLLWEQHRKLVATRREREKYRENYHTAMKRLELTRSTADEWRRRFDATLHGPGALQVYHTLWTARARICKLAASEYSYRKADMLRGFTENGSFECEKEARRLFRMQALADKAAEKCLIKAGEFTKGHLAALEYQGDFWKQAYKQFRRGKDE